jgi:hypothetical protein
LVWWRTAQGLSQNELAFRLSAVLGRTVQQQHVHHWESGVMPGADVAEAIRTLTGGAVTGDSFGRRKCPRA